MTDHNCPEVYEKMEVYKKKKKRQFRVIDGPSRASCHQHTSDSDQTSYSGMVARTIFEDKQVAINEASIDKLPKTSRQRHHHERTAMNEPSQSNRHGWTCLRGITSCSRLASNPSDCERAIRAE
ncbi:hypothetical protein YC2023_081232 [Brassica napus]